MIRRTLSRSANADPADVLATKRALAAGGLYTIPEWGLTSFPDEAMFRGIETLQRRRGIARPDGVAQPDDETAHALARLHSNAAAGGMVHVSAYEQSRGGQATPVSEHFRSRPGQGTGAGAKPLPPMVPPVDNPRVRGRDAYGRGNFGAGRSDKHGCPLPPHGGVDYETIPGQMVRSPVSGRVEVRPANNGIYNNGNWIEPYPDDPEKRGKLKGLAIITPDGHRVRVLYVDPDAVGLKPGQEIKAGEPIGHAQSLSETHPPTEDGVMTNHVHVDVEELPIDRRKKNRFKDPTDAMSK